MTEQELELLNNVINNSSFTSNEYGNNEFKIDENKNLEDNLLLLIDKITENAREHQQFIDLYNN